MAEQSITRTWKNIKTKSVTDTSTGNVRVFVIGLSPAPITGSTEIEVLRTTDGSNKWEYTLTGQRALLGYYNDNNATKINTQKLNQLVFTDAIKQYNNDRAAVLNNNANYANATEAEDNRRFFVGTSKIPGVIDPVTKQKISSDGTTLIDPTPPAPPGPAGPAPPGPAGPTPPDTNPPNFNLEISQETKKVKITTTPSTLRYPLNYDTKNNNYDFLKIQVAKYVPGLSGGLQEGTKLAIQSVKTRITDKGTSVILPMYPGISESNSVSWGSDELNPIQASFGAAAYNIINQFGSANFDFNKALQNAGDQLGAAVKNLANTPELQQYISAYFAGRAVGANILGRTTGMVVNPNLELLFKGPQLRSFKYSYRFTPRDNEEAKEIRRIIKFFKREMAVQKNDNHVFLKTPNVFFLDYIFRGTETNIHPFLNKIKPCALTSFNVNYTPDGTYMTYHDGEGKADGSMTSYTVDMQFDELEPIYRDDHSDSLDDPTMGY